MTVYVIAQVKITDRSAYGRYQARFWDVFRQFNGQLLAADENPTLLEGSWDSDKVILMAFPDQQSAQEFLQSRIYHRISKDRHAGAETTAIPSTPSQRRGPGRR